MGVILGSTNLFVFVEMNLLNEGSSIGRPPLLDGSNYTYWKARMKAFIMTLDDKAWREILTGWSPPTKTDDQGEIVPKLELEWSARKDKLAMSNSKALNAIFNVVDSNQFKLISTCESLKNAWDVL